MKKRATIVASIVCLLCGYTICTAAQDRNIDKLLHLLSISKIYAQEYPAFPHCVSVGEDQVTALYNEYSLYEDHRPGCGGDPTFAPSLGHFRLYKDRTAQILWLDTLHDRWLPLSERAQALTAESKI